jgi:NFU1 iron-sulfur cluster scaffold homolog, mitochondrial
MIPIATADAQQLRWVITASPLPPAGTVRQAPGRLGVLLDAGVISEIVVRPADVLITLSADHRWREVGDDIREALHVALLDPTAWRIDASDNTARLTAVVAELLAGPVGALAESHGGSIELVSVAGDTVSVRMSGACHGCPASESTLHDKLQHELRRRTGQKITVCSENHTATVPLGKKLLSLIVR